MYEVDARDEVMLLEDVPQSSFGAPTPLVIADEHQVVLAYYVENRPAEWDGSTVRMIDPVTSDEPIAMIRFASCLAHFFGPPNDEAFSAHPLAHRGLHPSAAFKIKYSSWIRRLERMNAIHEHHRPESFLDLQHLVFAFHDSTFECVCRGFAVRTMRGSIQSIIPEMIRLLR